MLYKAFVHSYDTIPLKRLCIYCGSTPGIRPEYSAAAEAMGRGCAARGITVVYGGGKVGMMGSVADAALAGGGKVIGVIPRSMVAQERGHDGVTELIVVESMHERKRRMAELADGFVALPGGIGTLEEIIEIFTWLKLGYHAKPVGLLNTAGYYTPLLRLLEHMRDEAFLSVSHREQLIVADEVEQMMQSMGAASLR
jgi:uncharacterized protein (TIGR00730 family)